MDDDLDRLMDKVLGPETAEICRQELLWLRGRPDWWAEVIECARDWRYSDEFIGIMVRNRLQQFDGPGSAT